MTFASPDVMASLCALQSQGVAYVTALLNDEQAHWLRRVLETRPKKNHLLDRFTIPPEIQKALAQNGLIRWRRDLIEITLDGIREIARHDRAQESGRAITGGRA